MSSGWRRRELSGAPAIAQSFPASRAVRPGARPCLLALTQLLFFLEQSFGATMRLIRIHAQSRNSLGKANRRSLASRSESHLYKELIKEGLLLRLSFAGNVFKSIFHPAQGVPSKLVGRYEALLPLFRLVGVRCIAARRVKSLLRHRSGRLKRRLTHRPDGPKFRQRCSPAPMR